MVMSDQTPKTLGGMVVIEFRTPSGARPLVVLVVCLCIHCRCAPHSQASGDPEGVALTEAVKQDHMHR